MQPIAENGTPRRVQRGGYAELEALLDLVEALCPRWPERPVATNFERFLL